VTSLLDVAASAVAHNFSVLPIRADGSKAPAVPSWRRYMEYRAREEDLPELFPEAITGIALVCGRVSGGLECLDFDDGEIRARFEEVCRASGLGDLYDRIAHGFSERTPRGAHLWYCCSSAKTLKLARDTDGASIIETKGEGGYAIIAPSHGRVHESKEPYVLERGGFESVVSITDYERKLLHEVARSLDRQTKPQEPDRERTFATGDGNRPGDEFARNTAWADILEPHGWRKLWTRGGITYWRRPGKASGVSATTNYHNSDLLYEHRLRGVPRIRKVRGLCAP
jgi:hypothetical protein